MARKEMYSLRVDRDQKTAWDSYAGKLGVDTSVMVRTVMDTATKMSPGQFVTFFALPKEEEPDDG